MSAFLTASLGLFVAPATRTARAHDRERVAVRMTTPQMTTLYDLPVSNHGARVRFLLYKCGLESEVDIISPMKIGGLRSEEYLALNPQGKMPLLVDGDSTVWESDAICRHLLDKHKGRVAAITPSSIGARTTAEVMCRWHDSYLGPIQGCVYKPAPPFGRFGSRRDALQELITQCKVLESLCDPSGPYLAGAEFSLADAAIFPTLVFIVSMLPKFDERLVIADDAVPSAPRDAMAEALGPRLLSYWAYMTTQDSEGMRIKDEIMSGVNAWEERGRWDGIFGAGDRDDAEPTIFDKILDGAIPSDKVYEDSICYGFRDINPVAPTHVLLIPKKRDGLTRLNLATAEHAAVLGHMMAVAAPAVAKQEGLEDFRVVNNCGESASQTVFHLHLHVIGGREMSWPPG